MPIFNQYAKAYCPVAWQIHSNTSLLKFLIYFNLNRVSGSGVSNKKLINIFIVSKLLGQ